MLDVLRETGEPMESKVVTAEVVRVGALVLDNAGLIGVHRTVVNVLKGPGRRGVIQNS